MDEILAKYQRLRADLDRPVTVRADVVQAFREIYDAATKVVIERDSLLYQLERMRARMKAAEVEFAKVGDGKGV